ncbi:hypothetical protein HMPREF1989_01917, partial [Porphyromonas gingivalis F0566]
VCQQNRYFSLATSDFLCKIAISRLQKAILFARLHIADRIL